MSKNSNIITTNLTNITNKSKFSWKGTSVMIAIENDVQCIPNPGDVAIRARLIQEGTICEKNSFSFAALAEKISIASKEFIKHFQRLLARYELAKIVERAKNFARIFKNFEEQCRIEKAMGPGAAVVRALKIKSAIFALHNSLASQVKLVLAAPTIKSIGFFSALKLCEFNTP